MNTNFLLCGVGGQGTVLASKLISTAAMAKGLNIRSAETIGMAQRGGSVVSHVRIGEPVFSPLIPYGGADVMIAFEPAEAVRCLPYLKKEGVIVVSMKVVQPITASLTGQRFESTPLLDYLKQNARKVMVLDTDALCELIGSPKIANTLLLGAISTVSELGLTEEDLTDAIHQLVKPQFVDLNIKAIKAGQAAARA